MKKNTYKYGGYLLVVVTIFCGSFLAGYFKEVMGVSQLTPFHFSYLQSPSFFDDSYTVNTSKNKDRNNQEGVDYPKGIIVNHHLLAADLIAKAFIEIETKEEKTVLLISPNHFSAGTRNIIASMASWKTPYGDLSPEENLLLKLQKENVISIEETPFEKEHGVSGIVPFIKKSLPNAKVIPILVKDETTKEEIDGFVNEFVKTSGEDIVIVGSFDFSHYQSAEVAAFHDQTALAVISSFDLESVSRLETDSNQGIYLLLTLLERTGATKFSLLANTNSAEVLATSTLEETTSYIIGTFSRGDTTRNDTVTILAFGDMMLDRAIRTKIKEHGSEYPFSNIKRFLQGVDIVVANAEGVFTDNLSVTEGKKNGPLQFTFDPRSIPTLKRLGFSVFSQANNHTSDFGTQGATESKRFMERQGIGYFGDYYNSKDLAYTKIVRGKKVTFVGYNQFSNTGTKEVIEAIQKAKSEASFVIVYPHFGNEYKENFSASQQDTAHSFIDAGADVIIGSHPHVLQGIEIYKGRAIFYSLGNFVFDQSNYGPTSEGLSVGVELRDSTVTYSLFPFSIKRGQVTLMQNKERDTLLKKVASLSLSDETARELIKKGKFSLVHENKIR